MKSNHVRALSKLELMRAGLVASALCAGLTLPRQALCQTAAAPPPASPEPSTAPVSTEGAAPEATAPSAPPPPAEAAPASTSVSDPPPPPGSSKLYERLEGGGWLGYGIQLDGQDVRPFGITLGLRGGIELSNHLYLGLMLGMFAGQSDSTTYYAGYRFSQSLWQSQVAAEVGYDLDLGPLIVRPYAGIGVNHMILSYTASNVLYSDTLSDTTSTDLYASLGGMAHLKLSKRIYGGIDTRVTLATTSPALSSLVIAASGGMLFF